MEEDRVIGPLRQLRQPLHDGLRQLQVAAAGIGTADPPVSFQALQAALAFLQETLLEWNRAEEFTLFIAVDGVIGKRGATAVMLAQHEAIKTMVEDLAKVAAAAAEARDIEPFARYLLPLLHGLYAVARTHLEAEDEAYLALLDDHLSESQVGVITDNLARIATRQGKPPEQRGAGVGL